MGAKVGTLYHFTCEHGYTGIEKTRTILPNRHAYLRGLGPLIWLTDLADPDVDAVGLSSEVVLTCDRLAYRYVVTSKACVPWSVVRMRAPVRAVTLLEAYGKPEHWWVARRPLLASEFVLDTDYRRDGEA